jgi:hypothetical protein
MSACPRALASTRARPALVGVSVAIALLTGCGGSGASGSAKASEQRWFRSQELSFRYPATWRAGRDEVFATTFRTIVYLSNQKLHVPCVTRHGRYNTTITCRQPIGQLRSRSILAWWSENGNPAWRFQQVGGVPIVVGGQPARLQLIRTDCGVHADVTLDAVVEIPRIADNWYEFTACMRGPGTEQLERQARDLLATVRFSRGY